MTSPHARARRPLLDRVRDGTLRRSSLHVYFSQVRSQRNVLGYLTTACHAALGSQAASSLLPQINAVERWTTPERSPCLSVARDQNGYSEAESQRAAG